MAIDAGKTGTGVSISKRLDVKGYVCPRPMVMTMNMLKNMGTGEVLEVTANDSSVKQSIPSLCERAGHKILSQKDEGGEFIFLIQK